MAGLPGFVSHGVVSISELAANSGNSWMSQTPNLHFARQLLIYKCDQPIQFLLVVLSIIQNFERERFYCHGASLSNLFKYLI